MEKSIRINPYTLAADRQGWRGLSLDGNCKRKAYTLLHNDQVLVTALLLIPGEKSIRHSHETGELSVHFSGELRPSVTWNPPGVLHGPPLAQKGSAAEDLQALKNFSLSAAPDIAALLDHAGKLELRIHQLEEELQQLRRAEIAPRVIVDVLFPPFKTTIDDPAYPEQKIIVGQWYD
jgi:hypothetical protein